MVRAVERVAPQIQESDPTARFCVMTTTTSNDFYVTLPSNASTDEFQANAPNHFTVRLPRMSVHWRFIHLNQAFRSVIGSPMRTLHVYSDIGGSSIVGGQVTDLLREVQYKQQGRGTVYFEPLHIQYLPFCNAFVDQIESQIAETNGHLVRFPGPTPTILILHFKRDLKKEPFASLPPSLRIMSLRRYTPPGKTGRGLPGVLLSTGQEILQDGLNESLDALGSYDQVVRRTTDTFEKAAKRKLKRKAGEALITSKLKVRDLFG